jgi:hypothetical protein
MPNDTSGIPRIDPNVQYVGVTKLRSLNATNLQGLNKTLVIQDNEQPLAVVISYDKFLEMQTERERILATLELLTNRDEADAFVAGSQDIVEGRHRPLSAIREDLEKKKKNH